MFVVPVPFQSLLQHPGVPASFCSCVTLAAHHEYQTLGVSVLLDHLHPKVQGVLLGLCCHVVADKDGVCLFVVVGAQGVEPLLPCGVPVRNPHLLVSILPVLDLEIHRQEVMVLFEATIHDPLEQTGLPRVQISHEYKLYLPPLLLSHHPLRHPLFLFY